MVTLSPKQLAALADEADVTWITILRRIVRLPVKRRAARRADRVLVEHGLLPKGVLTVAGGVAR